MAGFKSFVDPTNIVLTRDIIGIVGPNGCGKSNTIDAVRWVMGESSAKQLRGEAMADVIFNGSSERKPVGKASVELVFDNDKGILGGQYAKYTEISIKREVTREGQSNYYLNGSRCRRRDIADIFLGTGLGPRSYAIIEQGTISRLVEAKPDELRVFFEEAAGISKYKERRRETENRIRHTRENLERLEDLRGEVETRLARLRRQAKSAEKYKEYKEEERRNHALVLALRFNELAVELEKRDADILEANTVLEKFVSEQRNAEREIEQSRENYNKSNQDLNAVNGRFYQIGSDIARLEQAIKHRKELEERQQRELAQLEHAISELSAQMERDSQRLVEADEVLKNLEPSAAKATEIEQQTAKAAEEARAALTSWQGRWDKFNSEAGKPQQEAGVERTRIEHLERETQRRAARLGQIQQLISESGEGDVDAELVELSEAQAEALAHREKLDESLTNAVAQLGGIKARERELLERRNALQEARQQQRGRVASLEALQQAAIGSDDSLNQWLADENLTDLPRLVQQITVESGWETAVEIALGHLLEAIHVHELDDVAERLGRLSSGSVSFVEDGATVGEQHSLAGKVEGAGPLAGLLGHFKTVPDIPSALSMRQGMLDHQILVTPDGTMVGKHWLRSGGGVAEYAGTIERERELKTLEDEITVCEQQIAEVVAELEGLQEQQQQLEQTRSDLQAEVNGAHRKHSEIGAELRATQSRVEQERERRAAQQAEFAELNQRIEDDQEQIREARGRLETATTRMSEIETERTQLQGQRADIQQTVAEAEQAHRSERDTRHRLELELSTRRNEHRSLEANRERLTGELERLRSRREELLSQTDSGDESVSDQEQALAQLVAERVTVEQQLSAARDGVGALEQRLRTLDEQRLEQERLAEAQRGEVEQKRMAQQEIRGRAQGLNEQLQETGFEAAVFEADIAEQPEVGYWEDQLQRLRNRIDRLGPINLAAIEECEQEAERKEYLDAQFADLTEAMTTLETAIGKIDRETRSRFKDTFDKVNGGLQRLFPRLFGGGQAYLEMTGDDLLNTGVTITARPPGKRNSSIHMLSGGEKALTAVALVFAIFELNPAPFCMLDEVDAPLDDANVGRFCEMLGEMSQSVQFIIITHNKITMEMSQQLTGVTQREAGVSRLVAVDIDEAIQMAAS